MYSFFYIATFYSSSSMRLPVKIEQSETSFLKPRASKLERKLRSRKKNIMNIFERIYTATYFPSSFFYR